MTAQVRLTRVFDFSASYPSNGKLYGRNFRLKVTIADASASAEQALGAAVQRLILNKIHSRDLALNTDWFIREEINEPALLSKVWKLLAGEPALGSLERIELERDSSISYCLEKESRVG